jgi:hypothetical protein
MWKHYVSYNFSLKVSYSPGKKGGNFGLPLGAKLIVPESIFNKKDNITCEVAPPTQRWKYTPVLPVHEHLTSEIFLFSSSVSILKKAVVIQIPYYPIDPEHSEINVKGKWKDENEWVDVGFLKKVYILCVCVCVRACVRACVCVCYLCNAPAFMLHYFTQHNQISPEYNAENITTF